MKNTQMCPKTLPHMHSHIQGPGMVCWHIVITWSLQFRLRVRLTLCMIWV